jgi:regulator of protease activity HflC (stomatin/prohibitin superfamily)
MDNRSAKTFLWTVGVIIAIILVIILLPFKIIGAGERGVVLRFGAVNRIMPPGLSFKLPLMERVAVIDIKTQKEQVEANAASKDLQSVSAVIAVNYNVMPDKVDSLWKNIGSDYKVRVIDPAIQEAVKAATANYTAEELITKRPLVSEGIKTNLSERLRPDFIMVTELSIVNFDFSESFNSAIESKVTAEQNALGAKNKLAQVKFEAEQRIATAQAEAEAIKLMSEAANNEKYVSLKKVEVQLEMAKKWNGALPVNLYGSSPIPFIDIAK